MLERILLAVVITFCVYLFLNLGEKTSDSTGLEMRKEAMPGLVERIASFSW